MRRRGSAPPAAAAAVAATVGWLCCCWALLACNGVDAAPPQQPQFPGAAFFESFGPGWEQRWRYSSAKKYQGRFQSVQPEGFQDPAIQMPEANQHYGLATVLPQPLDPREGLVVQYEVKFQHGHSCGGAYLKLLAAPPPDGEPLAPEKLRAKTPFSIMFGPDRCGPDARVHVILRTAIGAGPGGNTTEHHLMSAPAPKEDSLSHIYSLVLHPNGRYKVVIDGHPEASGKLLTAKFSPPLQPPETIPDPDHTKPEDWVEEEMMDDPDAVRPAGWDDRRLIPDPSAKKPAGWLDDELPELPDPDATKPDDWDEATLGVWLPPPVKNPRCISAPGCGPWKPPLIRNPAYKGPWAPPQVPNPEYKGAWQQRRVLNPGYVQVTDPLALLPPIGGVALELWTTDSGYTFDSVLLGVGEAGLDGAAAYMRTVWRARHKAEMAAMMAKARAESRPPGLRHWASNLLQDVLEARPLEGLQPHMGPLTWRLQQTPEIGWAVLLLPAGLLGALLATRKRAGDAADEDDEPEQELAYDEDEVRRLSKQTSELQRQRAAAASGGKAGAAAAKAASGRSAKKQQQQQQQASSSDDYDDGGGDDGAGSDSSDLPSPPPVQQQPRRRVTSSRRA